MSFPTLIGWGSAIKSQFPTKVMSTDDNLGFHAYGNSYVVLLIVIMQASTNILRSVAGGFPWLNWLVLAVQNVDHINISCHGFSNRLLTTRLPNHIDIDVYRLSNVKEGCWLKSRHPWKYPQYNWLGANSPGCTKTLSVNSKTYSECLFAETCPVLLRSKH